jgi:hypothetical protein
MDELLAWLKSALPEFIAIDPMMAAYFDAIAPEILLIRSEAQTAPQQMWPNTATTGIGRLETIFGLPNNTKLTLAERRALVIAKMLASRTATVLVIRGLVSELSNGAAVVSCYPRQSMVWVKMVVDYGNPAYIDALKNAVSYYLPAHLEPKYIVYGQLTWGGLKDSGATWAGLPDVTWAELPFWNRGQHRTLWQEFRQNIYKHGELSWAALAGTSTTWAGLDEFDVSEMEGA